MPLSCLLHCSMSVLFCEDWRIWKSMCFDVRCWFVCWNMLNNINKHLINYIIYFYWVVCLCANTVATAFLFVHNSQKNQRNGIVIIFFVAVSAFYFHLSLLLVYVLMHFGFNARPPNTEYIDKQPLQFAYLVFS